MEPSGTELPGHVGEVTEAYLAGAAGSRLGRPVGEVALRSVTALSEGTSGDEVFELAVSVDGEALRLVLKLNGPGETAETFFYRDLAAAVPVDTAPVLDARPLPDGRGWVLMEAVEGKSPEAWDDDDHRAVVEAMAAMHARFTRSPELDRCSWLWRPTADAMAEIASGLRELVVVVQSADALGPLGRVYTDDRLRRIGRALDRAQELVGPMLAASETLVHGDYWFRNVMATADGRHVVLDWQGCRVFSGIWELCYFVDLLRAVGPGRYRDLPVAEDALVAWYLESLRTHGHGVSDTAFSDAYLRSKVIQPLAHWFLNDALTVVAGGAATVSHEAVAFREGEFRRWDEAAGSVLAL
jgi:hypothetical protein